jgi:hypothetical protein
MVKAGWPLTSNGPVFCCMFSARSTYSWLGASGGGIRLPGTRTVTRLWAACRNTSIRRIIGTASARSGRPAPVRARPPEVGRRRRPAAAPPHPAMRAAASASAARRPLVASITRRSQSMGAPLRAETRRSLGRSPVNDEWFLAVRSVVSPRRFAAGPGRAQSATLTCIAPQHRQDRVQHVVLPTPGPPVITSTLEASACRNACFWLSAGTRPVRRST